MFQWNCTVNGPFQKSKAFIFSSVRKQICLSLILIVISLFLPFRAPAIHCTLYKRMYSYLNGNYNLTIGWDFSGKCKLYRYYYYITICCLPSVSRQMCSVENVSIYIFDYCYNGLADTSFQRIHSIETIESSERKNLILCRMNLIEIKIPYCNG